MPMSIRSEFFTEDASYATETLPSLKTAAMFAAAKNADESSLGRKRASELLDKFVEAYGEIKAYK